MSLDTAFFIVYKNIFAGIEEHNAAIENIYQNPQFCRAAWLYLRPLNKIENNLNTRIMAVLVGKDAPDFSAKAVINGGTIVNDFTLSQFKGKYVILFFYPKDFTFVCPTELHAFQERLEDFKARGVELIAVSTDTEQSHWGWLQMGKNEGGIKGITYPIVADTNKTISYNYDVLAGTWGWNDDEEMEAYGELVAYRGLFLIDKDGKVRHQLVNDLPLGRNVDEAIRMVDALQFNEENGEVCPANWVKGSTGMNATHEGVADYLAAH